MTDARLEHANITVADPKAAAAELCALFDWHIRWEGEAIDHGYTVHVGSEDSYLAVYAPRSPARETRESSYATRGGLNHIGVVVDDIDAAEARVRSAGYVPGNHANYEPGRRFYFDTRDGVEIEVVAYN